jgi:hypothetical protein
MKKLLIFLALMCFVGCGKKIAGTTDETLGGNEAMIYYPNGAPAPGATVKVFDVNDTSRIPVAQALTDNAGHYAIQKIANGTYNIWAEKDTLVAVQDSVFILSNASTIKKDTLHASGSITAIIGMQPNDDPRSTYVQMIGSDRYSRNIDAQGYFTIDGLATGLYNLRVSTTQPNYTPTFFTVPAQSGQADTLKDTLWLIYTGIPIVTGLSAVYDTVTGVVHLTWNKTSFRNFQDYLVFRDPCDSIQPSTLPIKSVTDTVFSDTVFNKNKTGQYSFLDSNDYCLKYRVCIRNNSNIQGLTYKYIAVTAASPLYKISQVKIISSDTMYCNTPMIIRATVFDKYTGIKKCEWKIGESGQYATTSISQPETTIVIPDTLIPYLRCYIRVTNDNGFVAYDSMDLHVLIAWKQVSDFASHSIMSPGNGIVFNNQLLYFIGGVLNNNSYITEIYESSDGATWTMLTNSELSSSFFNWNSFLANFKNEIWLITDSALWHSNNGINWNSAGTIPMNSSSIAFSNTLHNTLYIGDTSGTIWSSNNGVSWNILTSTDSRPVSIPSSNRDSNTSFTPDPVSYSTVSINDTLFLSSTFERQGTTTIWKINNWEMPTLLTQYTPMDFSNLSATTVKLIEFCGKLCMIVSNSDTTRDNLLFYNNTGFYLVSKLPLIKDHPMEVMQYFALGKKLYGICTDRGTWVSK